MNRRYGLLFLVAPLSGVSIDCPNVLSLAAGLNMDIVNPIRMSALNNDCCYTIITGVTCDSQRVTEIIWNYMNLNGTINSTAMSSIGNLNNLHLVANEITGNLPTIWPPFLRFFNVQANRLTGTIPIFPNSMLSLYMSDNLLNGTLPLIWPPNLSEFVVYGNKFTGTIPITFPSTLSQLNVGTNKLSGGFPSKIPPFLRWLHVDNNFLTGLVPSEIRRTFVHLRLNENLGLYGDVTNITNAELNELWLTTPGLESGTKFTGKLVLNRPSVVFIRGNSITDLVVLDTSNLVYCDISDNPLLGNPNIANLTMCTKNGLYTSSTQTTSTTSISQTKTQSTLTSSAQLHQISFSSSLANSNAVDPQKPNFNLEQISSSPIFYIALGGFAVLCMVIVIIGKVIKHPKSNSKFGRKNSFGTLNTVASTRPKDKAMF